MDAAAAMARCPPERCQQSAVLRDVVGGDADRLVELLYQRTIGLFDSDTKASRSRIPAGAPIDVRDNFRGRFEQSRKDRRGVAQVVDSVTPDAVDSGTK